MRRTALLLCLLAGCSARPTTATAPPTVTPSTTPAITSPGAWATVTAADWTALQQQLAGSWKADLGEGKFIRVSYRVISSGSAMVETFVSSSGHETITVYHPDGAQLMLVHYCAQGNQVRLKATESAPGRLVFRYLDATNVGPEHGVMQELGVTISGDSFDQRSVYRSPNGKDGEDTLHFVREPG